MTKPTDHRVPANAPDAHGIAAEPDPPTPSPAERGVPRTTAGRPSSATDPHGAGREPAPVDGARQRQIRRRQTALAIGAVLAILAFALVQGFLGAPDRIPGTHPHGAHGTHSTR